MDLEAFKAELAKRVENKEIDEATADDLLVSFLVEQRHQQ